MLTNGLNVSESGVTVAAANTACHICAMQYGAENKNASLSECYNAVRGQQEGKLVKVLSTLKDPNGEKVCICSECAKKIVKDLEEGVTFLGRKSDR